MAAAGARELAHHQTLEQLHAGDVTALLLQTARRFQAKQSSSDYDCFHSRRGALQQFSGVLEIAKYENTVLVDAFDVRDAGRAAGSQKHLVERRIASVVAGDGFADRSHIDHPHSELKPDVVE